MNLVKSNFLYLREIITLKPYNHTKKTVFLLALILPFHSISTQESTEKSSEKSAWTKGGTFTFLINQSTFENWVTGGVSNISGAVGINYDLNYLKDNWSWDNKIIARTY